MRSQDIMEAVAGISEDWIEEAAEQPLRLPGQREISMNESKARSIRCHRSRSILGITTSLALISMVLPSLNCMTAYALQSLPAAGAYFRLVTVHGYMLAEGGHTVTVQVGEIQPESQSGTQAVRAEKSAEEVNAKAQRVTEEQVAVLWEEMGREGYSNLETSTQAMTDSDAWYSVCSTQARQNADSAKMNRYFTVRKSDGKLMQFNDLFAPGSDYAKTLSEEVKRQMQAEMTGDSGKAFFLSSDIPEDDSKEIKKDRNSYVNSESRLVICPDEGEVMPMSEGSLQFVMPENLSGLAI